ncbi:hypothetical protein KKA13_01980 [Patescibacteria group bacterium]|nr:hypothetical protein [Patescibacteria group bacterium]MBU1613190.1 hypothetical protein [Patescibacteria group bacterium]
MVETKSPGAQREHGVRQNILELLKKENGRSDVEQLVGEELANLNIDPPINEARKDALVRSITNFLFDHLLQYRNKIDKEEEKQTQVYASFLETYVSELRDPVVKKIVKKFGSEILPEEEMKNLWL